VERRCQGVEPQIKPITFGCWLVLRPEQRRLLYFSSDPNFSATLPYNRSQFLIGCAYTSEQEKNAKVLCAPTRSRLSVKNHLFLVHKLRSNLLIRERAFLYTFFWSKVMRYTIYPNLSNDWNNHFVSKSVFNMSNTLAMKLEIQSVSSTCPTPGSPMVQKPTAMDMSTPAIDRFYRSGLPLRYILSYFSWSKQLITIGTNAIFNAFAHEDQSISVKVCIRIDKTDQSPLQPVKINPSTKPPSKYVAIAAAMKKKAIALENCRVKQIDQELRFLCSKKQALLKALDLVSLSF